MPDIDVDFCAEHRDEIIKYVTEKYGADKVAQIGTFGTMSSKAVIKDVGRVLGSSVRGSRQAIKAYSILSAARFSA